MRRRAWAALERAGSCLRRARGLRGWLVPQQEEEQLFLLHHHFEFDVFVGGAKGRRETAALRALAAALRERGLRVWADVGATKALAKQARSNCRAEVLLLLLPEGRTGQGVGLEQQLAEEQAEEEASAAAQRSAGKNLVLVRESAPGRFRLAHKASKLARPLPAPQDGDDEEDQDQEALMAHVERIVLHSAGET